MASSVFLNPHYLFEEEGFYLMAWPKAYRSKFLDHSGFKMLKIYLIPYTSKLRFQSSANHMYLNIQPEPISLKATWTSKASDKLDQWQTPVDHEANIKQCVFIPYLPGNPVLSRGRRVLLCRTGPMQNDSKAVSYIFPNTLVKEQQLFPS